MIKAHSQGRPYNLTPLKWPPLPPQRYVLYCGRHTSSGMCIPVATQDASAKHYKGSVSEKIPGMFVGLCDTAKYSIRCLRVMLMLVVSGEQTVSIKSWDHSCFEKCCSITVRSILWAPLLFLRVIIAKVKAPPMVTEPHWVFNISEFPLTWLARRLSPREPEHSVTLDLDTAINDRTWTGESVGLFQREVRRSNHFSGKVSLVTSAVTFDGGTWLLVCWTSGEPDPVSGSG